MTDRRDAPDKPSPKTRGTGGLQMEAHFIEPAMAYGPLRCLRRSTLLRRARWRTQAKQWACYALVAVMSGSQAARGDTSQLPDRSPLQVAVSEHSIDETSASGVPAPPGRNPKTAPVRRHLGAEISVDATEEVLHVDRRHLAASDANPGTEILPFLTVGAAVARAQLLRKESKSVEIVIHPGTYRESISVWPGGPAPEPLLILRAYVPGSATISGSEVLSNWQQHSSTDTYVHAWPHDFGLSKARASTTRWSRRP